MAIPTAETPSVLCGRVTGVYSGQLGTAFANSKLPGTQDL